MTDTLDKDTFNAVMDRTIALLNAVGQGDKAQVMTLSTVVFKVVQFLRLKHPSVYVELKATTVPFIREQWALVLHRHMAELEQADGNNQGMGGMDPAMGSKARKG